MSAIATGSATFRIGVDVGGTFTDVVMMDEGSGEVLVAKVHTVPADPSQGCIAGIDKICKTPRTRRSRRSNSITRSGSRAMS